MCETMTSLFDRCCCHCYPTDEVVGVFGCALDARDQSYKLYNYQELDEVEK